MTSNETYTRSNEITEVRLNSFRATEYERLLADKGSRQRNAQALVDYLCGKFKIPTAKVVVANWARPHATDSRGRVKRETHGTYSVGTMVITIYDKTAVKKEQVAIKTFAETLLHEFIHHYDMTALKLGGSPHTAGFYRRIGDLAKKLNGEVRK